MIIYSQINAMVNKAQGKGYENENFYSNMKFQFLGIENIHVMRASLAKLVECEYCESIHLCTSVFFSFSKSLSNLNMCISFFFHVLFVSRMRIGNDCITQISHFEEQLHLSCIFHFPI